MGNKYTTKADFTPRVGFVRMYPGAVIPTYAHSGDSGMDVRSMDFCTIPPHGRATVGTGLAAEIPYGYEIQVRPRSGLAKAGIMAAFGTIDNGYHGEIKVTLYNLSDEPYAVAVDDRIAQLVLAPVTYTDVYECTSLSDSERGEDGFGSTGIK